MPDFDYDSPMKTCLPLLALMACTGPEPTGPDSDKNPDTDKVDTEVPDTDPVDTDTGPPLVWQSTGLAAAFGDFAHSTVLEVAADGETVMVGFSDDDSQAYFGWTDDLGGTWDWTTLTGINQAKALIELANGDLVIGGSSRQTDAILKKSEDGGQTWREVANAGSFPLPHPKASTAWDLTLLPDGTVFAALDNPDNVPTEDNPAVWISTDNAETFQPVSPLPGTGSMSLAFDGTALFAATSESDEHDDPDLAGQARLFRSVDLGNTWEETGTLIGANRAYNLVFIGTRLYATAGIRGAILFSDDHGDTFEACAAVPDGEWLNPQSGLVETAEPVTRVYDVVKLIDGRLLIGTGNRTGDVFVSDDDCASWEWGGDTQDNIVTWGLGQTSDGTVWISTGSRGGDVYISGP